MGVSLGMVGNRRSRTLSQPEPAELRQIPADKLLKKEESARGFLPDDEVFCHKTPPFWRTDGP